MLVLVYNKILNNKPLKLADHFPYLGSNIPSTERDDIILIEKTLSATNRLSAIWESDLSDKRKREFLPVLPYQYYYMGVPFGL